MPTAGASVFVLWDWVWVGWDGVGAGSLEALKFAAPGATPLHKAVAKGHGSIAELLLSQGAVLDIADVKG